MGNEVAQAQRKASIKNKAVVTPGVASKASPGSKLLGRGTIVRPANSPTSQNTANDSNDGRSSVPILSVSHQLNEEQVVYKFRVVLTAEMRATTLNERKKRHLLAWESIFQEPSGKFVKEFERAYKSTKKGERLTLLHTPYKKHHKILTYSLSKKTYNSLDFENKQPPIVNSNLNQAEMTALLIIAAYRKLYKKLMTEQKSIVDRKLKYIIERISHDKLEDNAVTTKLLLLLDKSIAQTAELDDHDLVYLNGNALSYRNQFSKKQVYSPEVAVDYLERYLSVLNLLRIARAKRSKDLKGTIESYNRTKMSIESILPAIDFLRALEAAEQTIRQEKAIGSKKDLITGKTQAETARDKIQEQFNAYLKQNDLTSKRVGEIRKNYAVAFQLLFVISLDQAITAHMRLLSFEVRKQRESKAYFGQLYLDWLAMPKGSSPSVLEKKYPVIQFFNQKGYEKRSVYALARSVQKNKHYQRGNTPERYFAADLQRMAHRQLSDLTLVKNKVIGTDATDGASGKELIWHLDKALTEAYGELRITKSNYQWVIAQHAGAQRSKISWIKRLYELVLLVISIVPIGRVFSGLVRLGVSVKAANVAAPLIKGTVAVLELEQARRLAIEIEQAKSFERTNLSSASPSYIWVAIALAGAGNDIADLAKVARVTPAAVVKDFNLPPTSDNFAMLRQKYKLKNEASLRAIQKSRKNYEEFKAALASLKVVPRRPASGIAIGDEVTNVIYYGLRAGIAGVDKYFKYIAKARAVRALNKAERKMIQSVYDTQYIKLAGTNLKLPKRLRGKLDIDTVAWLNKHGMWTKKAIRSFGASGTGDDVLASLVKFKDSPGFEKVVADWLSGGYKQEGARFVIRYSLKHFKISASKIRFEVRIPRNPTLKADGSVGGVDLRITDAMVNGVKYEFKNIKEIHRRLVYTRKTAKQIEEEKRALKERIKKTKKEKLEAQKQAKKSNDQDPMKNAEKEEAAEKLPAPPVVYFKGGISNMRKPGQMYKDVLELLMVMGPSTKNPRLRWIINGKKGLKKDQVVKKIQQWLNETDLKNLPAWNEHGETLLKKIIVVTNG